MGARVDILREHADEAAFLYGRFRRSCRLLDGNARQTRSLLARIDAHVDALALFARDASAVVPRPAETSGAGERFVATAVAALTGDGLEDLAGVGFDHAHHVAVRDAMLRYATAPSRAAVDAWLSAGSEATRAVGVELLARWRDPRAQQVASRAVRRGEGALRAAGVVALGRLGEPVSLDVLLAAMRECEKQSPWRDELLDATAPERAIEAARAWDGPRCDMAWVLLGLTGDDDDQARLLDAFTVRGAVGALPAALALAGAHPALDDAWSASSELAVSNALREAAYVVLGGEAPPVVVRDDMPEEPEDRAQRAAEDPTLRARMAATPAGLWRWGALEGSAEMRGRVEALGPRHRRWALAAGAMGGGARAVWDDVTREAGDA